MSQNIATKLLAGAGTLALALGLAACGGSGVAKGGDVTCKQFSQMSKEEQKQVTKDFMIEQKKDGNAKELTDEVLGFTAEVLKGVCEKKGNPDTKLRNS
ncbi:MAG: hypothetical protein Q4C71_02905 [Microbacteriaceae bacterium]|nr:hypothetical protein [Microbacteriaceae bacterium]